MSYKYYEGLKANRDSWSAEHPNCIPFKSLPRFSEHMTITKGTYYLVTASSGVGKSRFVKDMFIHNPIEFCKKNNLGVDITLFSLEESIDRFYHLEICRQLYTKYGISINIKELLSTGLRRLSTQHLEYVKEIETNHFPYLRKNLNVMDIRDSDRVYNYIMQKAKDKGRIITKTISTTAGTIQIFDKYIPYKDEYVMFVLDHIKLLSGRGTIKNIIDKFSSEYIVELRDRFNFIFVVVQQQVASKESKQFTKLGSLIDSMEPSLDGLGEHKLTQQDANVVLALYHPHRHSLKEHNGYNVGAMKNSYRSVKILKSRDGLDDLSIGMHFEGAAGVYTELPRPNTNEIRRFYE
jgi:hypothetical protein